MQPRNGAEERAVRSEGGAPGGSEDASQCQLIQHRLNRQDLETGKFFDRLFDHGFVLLRLEGTGGVDEAASGREAPQRGPQDGRRTPVLAGGVRLGPPGAKLRVWGGGAG